MANRCFPYHAIASLTHRHTDIQRDTHVCRSPLRERVFLPDYTPVFYGVLGFAPGHSLAKTQQVQELASQLRHASLQVSSLAQDLQCPLRPLLYDWHSPNPSPAFEIPWLLPKKG